MATSEDQGSRALNLMAEIYLACCRMLKDEAKLRHHTLFQHCRKEVDSPSVCYGTDGSLETGNRNRSNVPLSRSTLEHMLEPRGTQGMCQGGFALADRWSEVTLLLSRSKPIRRRSVNCTPGLWSLSWSQSMMAQGPQPELLTNLVDSLLCTFFF